MQLQALLVADPQDIRPAERMLAGALAGASAQVNRKLPARCGMLVVSDPENRPGLRAR